MSPSGSWSREANHEVFVALHSSTLRLKEDFKTFIGEVGIGATPVRQHDNTKMFGQLLSYVYGMDNESPDAWLRLASIALSRYTYMQMLEGKDERSGKPE